ncbi:MAG: hypothetical protein QOE01_2458 [Actinomycetota bacterium]|nr:hypothetical protein [Actinomycetota bacterium]
MFERFTNQARAAVVAAQFEARTHGHHWIGTEHLLIAVLADRDSAVSGAMRALGLTVENVRCGVLTELRPGPGDDSEALRAFGIDLDTVRARVEERFEPGALDRGRVDQPVAARGRLRRALRRRARRCADPGSGHLRFTARAKKSLELALREAIAVPSTEIRVEHLVLGLMRTEGLAARVVAALGVPPDDVRRAVLELGEAA